MTKKSVFRDSEIGKEQSLAQAYALSGGNMDTSTTWEKIRDWLVLPRPEYCDAHGHKVAGWDEATEHVQHGRCIRCGQELYKLEPNDQVLKH